MKKNKQKNYTLNKFYTKYPIQSDRSYFLFEEKSCKEFFKYFFEMLLHADIPIEIKNKIKDSNDINILSNILREYNWGFLQSKKYKTENDLFVQNLFMNVCNLIEIQETYKIIPKKSK